MQPQPGQIWSCGKFITSRIIEVKDGLAIMEDIDDKKKYQIDCRILLDEHQFGARCGDGWKMIKPTQE